MKTRILTLPALGLLLCGCSVPTPTNVPPSASVATTSNAKSPAPLRPADAIDWTEARTHLGSAATVCGPVVSTFTATNSNGRPTFLNIGVDYPDPAGMTVIIFDDYVANFPTDPAIAYDSATICVTGTVQAHEQFVQIEARTPDQIVVE